MLARFVGMFFGFVLGYVVAGPVGGAVGLGLGMVTGLLWESVKQAWTPVPTGAAVVHESQAILCIPKGQVATVDYLRDAGSGRWLDVAKCTLCDPEDKVGCAKRCLHLVRDVLPPRKHPVQQPAATPV